MGQTVYTPELETIILQKLSEGLGLNTICREDGMPAESTVRLWQTDDTPPGFAARYARARSMGLDAIAEDIIAIADDTSKDTIDTDHGSIANSEWINRSRLRVDSRKWLLSKLRPDKYGDRITQEHTGPGGKPLEIVVTRVAE